MSGIVLFLLDAFLTRPKSRGLRSRVSSWRSGRGDEAMGEAWNRRGRAMIETARRIAGVAALALAASQASADIFQWEWVDPGDHTLGKRQSTTLCPDGAGVSLPAPSPWP